MEEEEGASFLATSVGATESNDEYYYCTCSYACTAVLQISS